MEPEHTLAESSNFSVWSDFEEVHLRRSSGTDTVIGHFHGDPECALIDGQEGWCAVGGSGLIVYWLREPFCEYEYDTICDQWREFGRLGDTWEITKLEQTGADQLRFHVDPNSGHSGTYDLNVQSLRIQRVAGDADQRSGATPELVTMLDELSHSRSARDGWFRLAIMDALLLARASRSLVAYYWLRVAASWFLPGLLVGTTLFFLIRGTTGAAVAGGAVVIGSILGIRHARQTQEEIELRKYAHGLLPVENRPELAGGNSGREH